MALFSRPKDAKGAVKVRFAVSSDGSLIGEPVILQTDSTRLVPYAMEAIKAASPFAPFPASLPKEKEDFSIALNYQ
jgi:outer membrane biosynthesis protein TonB